MRGRFEAMIRQAQNNLCKEVEALDGGTFHEDAWTRPGGGGGVSRVLQVPHNANKHTSVNMHGVWCVWHARQAGQPQAARPVLCKVRKEQQRDYSWSD